MKQRSRTVIEDVQAQEASENRIARLRRELIEPDLTVDEVAAILSLERSTVLRYLRDHVIVGYQNGRTYLVPEEELRAYKQRLIDRERDRQRIKEIAADIERKYELWVRTRPDDSWAKEECPQCGSTMLSSETQFHHADYDIYYPVRLGTCAVCNFALEREAFEGSLQDFNKAQQRAHFEDEVDRQLGVLQDAHLEATKDRCKQCGYWALFQPPTIDELDFLELNAQDASATLIGTCQHCNHFQVIDRPQRSNEPDELPF
jgi:excisionase family DNA binding protein